MASFRFPDYLRVKHKGKANRNSRYPWTLIKDFRYRLGHGRNMVEITAPAGMTTDFASVPRIFWVLFAPTDSYLFPAIIHDHLYKAQEIEGKPISRKRADDIFMEGMEVYGVRWLRRWMVYLAVRIGGRGPWEKNSG